MSDLHHDDSVQGPCIVGDPDRKARRDVKFTCVPGFRSGVGFYLTVTEEQWPSVEPFVREVQGAR